MYAFFPPFPEWLARAPFTNLVRNLQSRRVALFKTSLDPNGYSPLRLTGLIDVEYRSPFYVPAPRIFSVF